MLSREDNECLTRTGAGTPMGALFRQYWLPVLLSEQLAERDGPPVRVKVLGEQLLAFRDSAGTVALVEPRCPHRGADLYFGRNEEGGIRCAYHGWKFDALGRCVQAPTVPAQAEARMCERARIRACPTQDWGGFIWAYLGPGEAPALPQLEFGALPPAHRHVSRKFQECNWAQAAEGGVDTAHFSFLHQPVAATPQELADKAARATRGYARQTMGEAHVRWMREDPCPRYEVQRHEAGLVLGGARRADEGRTYWRIAQYLMPCHGFTPSATEGQTLHAQCWVPVDDENCWVYLYSWNPARPLTDEERRSYRSGGAVYPEMDASGMPVRNRSNDYLLDRQMQKTENFSGIVGVSEQDAAIQDSQGRIADRTRELLGPTDLGVVQLRRLMLEAARTVAGGGVPPGRDTPQAYRVRAGGVVADAALGFEEVMQLRFGDPLGRVDGPPP